MVMNVLVVTPEEAFASQLAAKLAPHAATVKLHVVASRKEAIAVLELSTFQKIITALKIPGVADGYRFLQHLATKITDKKNIIALVDQKSETVQSGIAAFGIDQSCAKNDLDTIVRMLISRTGLNATTAPPHEKSIPLPTAGSTDEIRAVLNQVMGPVGMFIFQQAVNIWKNRDNHQELLDIIAKEIGVEEQVRQFHLLLAHSRQK
ncbi:MAG: hypothetical protein OEL83_10195 [Desulforhopalus sp.]|nr:hypothetical protein [Desulforhopalus sp.]